MTRTPSLPPSDAAEALASLGPLAHRMTQELGFVAGQLQMLSAAFEPLRLQPEDRARAQKCAMEAANGVDRLSDLVRELKVLSWGPPPSRVPRSTPTIDVPAPALDDLPLHDDDTWDSEHAARILVIDDEETVLVACRRALQIYTVDVAATPEAALDLLATHTYDIVLHDLSLAGFDGPALFSWLSERRPLALSRVVFMSGGAFSPALRTFLAGIRNPVLQKPFDTKTLRWMVAQKLRELDKPTPTRVG